MSFSITTRRHGAARTYLGTGPRIPVIDADSALEVLALAEAGALPAGNLAQGAVRALCRKHGVGLAEDAEDDFWPHATPDHDLNDIDWALSRARCGDLEDAAIHLERGLSGFPQAVEALELIRAGLRS
jgi:hypothetical protein